ncbi:DNA topoisomerase IV [Flavobacterium agricola]|uniref:DNA topoisomerase IV n=1 Tax=Flavobacterium agricola TaxID=2870839 RepID=A0ABY6LZL6_9FLAO|nr:DNA topoisomerase IV [Flavobacterium agricola]UYW01679.1 DNA topoisomerase IV [Flavobacterium agricola]
MNKFLIIPFTLLFISCYQQQNDCAEYKTGKFEFKQDVNGVEHVSIFERNDSLQIETFNGKTDTASVRWVSDCEFILQKINPKNMAEKQAINMKIVMTDKDGYTFEYSFVGQGKKQRGYATKIN